MDPAPPPYAIATAPSYDVATDPQQYSPPGVTIKEPTGYRNQVAPLELGESSVTAGGLRLDKAVKIGNRLIIDFEKVSCCPWETTGLDPDCKNVVPQELREKGISASMWNEWCEDLTRVQKKSPSIGGCLCIFCFPGFIPQCMLCVVFCPTSADHPLKCLPCFYGDWYVGLDKWQRNVNSVLNKKDMHAKLKTYKPHGRAPNSLQKGDRVAGKDDGYEMSMLEIALTADESKKLQSESWDCGVNDGCTSGRGRLL